ncbi:hypothetical protein TPENAI_61266 [Tenacibaculum litopenaei]|uniref:hypothetical protein n=1 Tax=Tenacibaculum litopenaei TaxID=396016 RepID=UPI0038933D91
MIQTITQLGTTLNRKEQQNIKGGGYIYKIYLRGRIRCMDCGSPLTTEGIPTIRDFEAAGCIRVSC